MSSALEQRPPCLFTASSSMDKRKGKMLSSAKQHLPPHQIAPIKKAISVLASPADNKVKVTGNISSNADAKLRRSILPYEQLYPKFIRREAQLRSKASARPNGDISKVQSKIMTSLFGNSKSSRLVTNAKTPVVPPPTQAPPIKRKPQTQPPVTRLLGKFPKLETRGESTLRQRSKQIQSIPLRTSLVPIENVEASQLGDKQRIISKQSSLLKQQRSTELLKSKITTTTTTSKQYSPYKNHQQQLPSIYNTSNNRPRSRQQLVNPADEAPRHSFLFSKRPPRAGKLLNGSLSSEHLLSKQHHQGDNSNKLLLAKETLRFKSSEASTQISNNKVVEAPLKKHGDSISSSGLINKKPATAIPSKTTLLPSQKAPKTPSSSRRLVTTPPPPPDWVETASTNFSAVLSATISIMEAEPETLSIKKESVDELLEAEPVCKQNSKSASITTQVNFVDMPSRETPHQSSLDINNSNLDNVDNLPYTVVVEPGHSESQDPDLIIINPPVNTPVSPLSDASDVDFLMSTMDLKRSSDSEEDAAASFMLNDIEVDHDFVTDYLQLESMKEVNHIAQAMCRAKICREVKGADPGVTLDELKRTQSQYLQLPCFSDPNFFTKIKIPLNTFMNGKKPDRDLVAIQYLQNRMDSVYSSNQRALKRLASKQQQQQQHNSSSSSSSSPNSNDNPHPGMSLELSTSKDRYVHSIAKLFKSLQLPPWAKECFGSGSEEESCASTEEDQAAAPGTASVSSSRRHSNNLMDCSTERTAIAKRILSMFENGKLRKINGVEKASRLKKKTLPKEYDDDTSSDNISESP